MAQAIRTCISFTPQEGKILLCYYQRLSDAEPRFILSFCSVNCSWLHPKTGPTYGPKTNVAIPGIPPRNHLIQKNGGGHDVPVLPL